MLRGTAKYGLCRVVCCVFEDDFWIAFMICAVKFSTAPSISAGVLMFGWSLMFASSSSRYLSQFIWLCISFGVFFTIGMEWAKDEMTGRWSESRAVWTW